MEVGEYCRNAEGLIFKVDKEKINLLINDFFNMGNRDIVKHSKNIIDLVGENDYVNGNKVVSINGELYVTDVGMLSDIEIKSILTHEMYEREAYKIE